MSKYLLREYFSLCPDGICNIDLLSESEKQLRNNGDMILTGILQTADQKNGNGRIYPRKVLEREMENYQKVIREKRSVAELDHPEESVISLKNVSHIVLRSWWDGNDVWGTVKVLDTPSGKILRSLVESGVRLGISSRALGSVQESREGTVVQNDLSLICFDIVSEPSTFGAYLSLQESKQHRNEIFTKADRLNRALNLILEK